MSTANDPELQTIPDVDCKWSRRKSMNGMEFGFPDFYFCIYLFSSTKWAEDENAILQQNLKLVSVYLIW